MSEVKRYDLCRDDASPGDPPPMTRYKDGPYVLYTDYAALNAKADRLAEALRKAKRGHYYCDDPWYSCPKDSDGCADESQGEDCNCGADRFNAEIDTVLAEWETK